MAEQSRSCFLDGPYLRPQEESLPSYYYSPLLQLAPPPVIARYTKYVSLWQSLSYCDQWKLRRLLKQLEPIDQDRLLRMLEPLDQQGRDSLFKVLYRLTQSEQVELLGILNEHEVLEQLVILKALNGLHGKFGLIWHHALCSCFEHVPKATAVLLQFKSLRPLDLLKLLRLLDGLDCTRQCMLESILVGLDRTRLCELVSILEGLDRTRQCELVSILEGLDCTHQCELVSILEGLDRTHQCELVSILEGLKQQEQRQLLTGLVGLNYFLRDKLLEMIVQLKGQKKRQLLRVLDGLDSSLRQEMLEVMVGLKLTGKEVLLRELDSLGSPKRILKVIREYCEAGLLSSNTQSSLFKSGFTMLIPSLLERQKRLADELDRTLYLEAQLRTDLRAKLRAKLWEVHFLCWLRTLSIDSGGSRNLLLDGWWLEFWEIILLAAGDVERNPGPTFMTEEELAEISNALLEEDDLSGVYDEVRPVSSKWFQFCCCLGILASRLDAINRTQNGDCDLCLFNGLKEWLQRNYNTEKHGSPTWRKLVAAVDNSSGGNNHVLAQEVAKKHKDKRTHAQSVMKPVEDDCAREDSRHGHQHSAAFSKMYGAITRGIGRSLDVDDLRQFLRYYPHPRSSNQRYIQPSMYIGVETTREILDRLYPEYINPGNIYLLEEIISLSNSRQCKRLLDEYIRKYPY